MQVQRNISLHKNNSVILIDTKPLSLPSSEQQIRVKNNSEIISPVSARKSCINISPESSSPIRRSRSRLQTVSFRVIEPKIEEDGEDESPVKVPSLKLIQPSQRTLRKSDTVIVTRKEIEAIESPLTADVDFGSQKKLVNGRAKILRLFKKGVLKQSDDKQPILMDKVEIVKRIRNILSMDYKERGDADINFLMDCYKERIDFFKMICSRYGITTLKKVFKAMKYETFDKGQKIFQIGDKGDKFFIILSGKVKVAILKDKATENEGNMSFHNQTHHHHPSISNSRRSSFINAASLPNSPQRRPSVLNTPHSPAIMSSNSRQLGQVGDILSKQNSMGQSSNKPTKATHLLFKMMDHSTSASPGMKRRISKLLVDVKSSSFSMSAADHQESLQEQIKDFQEELRTKYNVIRELGKGESFGEMSMKLGKHSLRTATVYAEEKCEFAVISRYDYMHIITPLEQQDTKDKIEFLTKIPYFASWEKKDLKMLSYCLHEQSIPKSSYLFKEGDQAKDLYFISSGNLILLI